MNREKNSTETNKWIRIISVTSLLLGLLAVWSFSAPQAFSEDKKGFQKGEKTFNNPFKNVKKGPGTAAPGLPPQTANSKAGAPRKKITLGNPPTKNDVPAPARNRGGIQVGGEPPSGVIANPDADVLTIDSETGFGSDEIITDFNYPDADILDIAKTIGKLTGKNFIFDKNVKGRISIISNAPITVGDAWRAFLTALDINGYTLIPSGKYIRLARQRDARDKQLNTYLGKFSPESDALITRVFTLKYISADEVARTFRSFMPANSRIIPYAQTNTVIVTDTGSNIRKLQKMLDFLDVEGFDAGINVIPVKHASAVELAKLIDALLPGQSGGRSKSKSRRSSSGSFTARRTKEGGFINTIIADDRTNNLIVHANTQGANQVRKLVRRLDRKVPFNKGTGKLHVIYLQFADAEAIAKTLGTLSQSPSRSSRRSSRKGSGSSGTNPNAGSLFQGAIRVAADKATNSLVITASPTDYATVRSVIAKLDIPRDEVYVEIIIMEMVIGRDFDYSANIAFPTSGIALTPRGGRFA